MNKTKKGRLAAWLAGIAAWFILLGSLLLGVYVLTHAYGFYEVEYAKYDAASDIGVSYDGLIDITRGVLDYLNDARPDLDMQMEMHGQTAEVFTQREKDHMVDVRALIELGRAALLVCAVAGFGLLALAIVLAAKSRTGRRMCVGYLIGAGCFLIVMAAIAACFFVNFTEAFYTFHRIFFRNDLWMLPSDAVLIKMVPEQFFSDCALLLAAFFVIGLLSTCLAAFVCALCLKNADTETEGARIRKTRRADGQTLYEIEAPEETRPDAEEIFQRLGLDGETKEAADVQTAAVEEAPAAVPAAQAQISTNLRLEMKLDLCMMKTENGIELVPDPNKPLDIRVRAGEGEMSMLVQALETGTGRVYLNASSEQDAGPQTTFDESKPQGNAPQASTSTASDGAVPSVDELLKRMNEMMKWYPKDDGEDDKV